MGHPTMQENDTAKLTPTTIINAAISLRIYFINFEYWIMHIKEHAIPNIANDVLESIVAE